jgi:hypothetical protein
LKAELEGWKETNFESDLDKLKKEAEERLDAKVKELEGNLESVGVAGN